MPDGTLDSYLNTTVDGITVPGANSAIAPPDNTEQVVGQLDEQTAITEQEAGQIKAEQAVVKAEEKAVKSEKEQQSNELSSLAKAQKAELNAQKAAIDAELAQAQAGIVPQGAELAEQGREHQSIGQSIVTEADYDQKEQELEQENLVLEQERAEFDEISREAEELRAEPIADVNRINNEISELINSKIERPSPGVLDVFSVLLGALGAPATGGKNLALEMMENRIQQEVDLELENKQIELKALRMQQGIAEEKSGFIEKSISSRQIIAAQKYANLAKQMEIQAAAEHMPARKRGELLQIAGKLREESGNYQLKVAQTAAAMELKQREFRLKQAKSRVARARGNSGAQEGYTSAVYKKGTLMYHPGAQGIVDLGNDAQRDEIRKDDKTSLKDRVTLGNVSINVGGQKTNQILIPDVEERKELKRSVDEARKINRLTETAVVLLEQAETGIDGALDMTVKSLYGINSPISKEIKSALSSLNLTMKNVHNMGAAFSESEQVMLSKALYGTNSEAVLLNMSVKDLIPMMHTLNEGYVEVAKANLASKMPGVDPKSVEFKKYDAAKHHRRRAEAKNAQAAAPETTTEQFNVIAEQEKLAKKDKTIPKPTGKEWNKQFDTKIKEYSEGKLKTLDKGMENEGSFDKTGSFTFVDMLEKTPEKYRRQFVQKLTKAGIEPPTVKKVDAKVSELTRSIMDRNKQDQSSYAGFSKSGNRRPGHLTENQRLKVESEKRKLMIQAWLGKKIN